MRAVSSAARITGSDGYWSGDGHKVGQDGTVWDTNTDAVLGSDDVVGIPNPQVVHPVTLGYNTTDTSRVAFVHEGPEKRGEVWLGSTELVQVRQTQTDGLLGGPLLHGVDFPDGLGVLAGGADSVNSVRWGSHNPAVVEDSGSLLQ